MNYYEYKGRIIDTHTQNAIKSGNPAKYLVELSLWVDEFTKKTKHEASEFYQMIYDIRKKIATILNG